MSDAATIHRDLRTGRTIWQDTPLPHVPVKRAQGETGADILIVGAGITGAVIADVLTETGLRVAIAERRKPMGGSTMATTALIQFELDTPLLLLGKAIGDRKAQRAWLRSKRAVAELADRVQDIRCDWCDRPSLYLAGDVLNGRALRDEADAREDIGLPATFVERNQLLERYGIEGEAAVRSKGNAECNPVLLAGGLLRRAIGRGATIYAPSDISSVEETGNGVVAHAKDGATYHAGAIVYATGYERPTIVPAKGLRVVSTWAIATAPQPDRLWPSRATLWEASQPYLYVRTTPDSRVLAGGEDQEIADARRRDALIPEKAETIRDKLRGLLPHLDAEPEYAWAGSFGVSKTGMPAIGLVPGFSRTYAVEAFGGNGITFAMVAADIMRGALTGKPDPDAELFAFG